MIVGVARFELFMPYNHSLKEKRQILRKLQERVFAKFRLNIAEVDYQDKWQRAELGFALVGNDGKSMESIIAKVMNFVVSLELGEINREFKDMVYYE